MKGGTRWLTLEPDVCPACADIAWWRKDHATGCQVEEPGHLLVATDARHQSHRGGGLIPLPNGAMLVA